MICREEQSGSRCYTVEWTQVHVTDENEEITISRKQLGEEAKGILALIRSTSEDVAESTDELEKFLDRIKIYDLAAKTDDRTDLYVVISYDNRLV